MLKVGDTIHGYSIDNELRIGAFCNSYIVSKGRNSYFMKAYSDPTALSADFSDFQKNQSIMIPRLKALGPITETIIEDFEDNGFYYQVKELIDSGKNLAEWLCEDTDFNHRKDVARQFCDILSAVHAKNIIHQDLKPEQVMTVVDGSKESGIRLVLTDFDWSIPDGRVVRRVGTPWYFNPDSKPSFQSDIFTFGIILCELLTGGNPYSKMDTMGEYRLYDDIEWKSWVNHKDYLRPSEINDDETQITPAIDDVIVKCLDPDPSKRPSLSDISSVLRGAASKPMKIKLLGEGSDKLLIVPGGAYGRKHFKEIFKNTFDSYGNLVYKYLDPDYSSLLLSQSGDELMVCSPAYGHAKNRIVLNGKDLTNTPVSVRNGDKIGIFSVTQGKIVYNFTIEC